MFKMVHLYDLNIHKLVTKRDTQSLYQILQQFHQQQQKIHIILDNLHILKEGSSIMANSFMCSNLEMKDSKMLRMAQIN